MRDGAQAVLDNLPAESRKNFTELCKALENRYAPSNQTELYRAQLRDRRQKASESIPELGQDVRRLTNLTYATAPADVREIMAKEQLIDALHSSEMRLRIKQSRPKNLNEAVCLAVELDAFNNAEKRRQEPTGSVRAAEGRHTTDFHDSVEKMITETSKTLSEMRQEIRSLRESIERKDVGQRREQSITGPSGPLVEPSRKNIHCYYCGKEGHIKKKCRFFLKFQEQMKVKEGQTGHESGQGASRAETHKVYLGSMHVAKQTGQSGLFVQAFVNNRSAKLLMDTGATLSIVAP